MQQAVSKTNGIIATYGANFQQNVLVNYCQAHVAYISSPSMHIGANIRTKSS